MWMSLPVLAAVPSLPWIAFTGTLAMAYTFFLQDPWAIPWWARAVEAAAVAAGPRRRVLHEPRRRAGKVGPWSIERDIMWHDGKELVCTADPKKLGA